MDLELRGKVALVTGAGQGVGREIAKVLASEGAKVVVNDLFRERAEAVAKEITDAGGAGLGIQADVTDLDQVKAMVGKTADTSGPVDILVNNAGIPPEVYSGNVGYKAFVEDVPSSWKKVIDLNTYGCLHCTHSVLGSMIERKGGKIVSIISEAGRVGEPFLAVYSGAKAGILGFSKALAREVGRYCINVNCIAIGATAHEGTRPFMDPDATPESDPNLNKTLKVYPVGRGLGRIGRPSDAAAAVAFLVSSKAAFITGQCLSVSGGFSMVS